MSVIRILRRDSALRLFCGSIRATISTDSLLSAMPSARASPGFNAKDSAVSTEVRAVLGVASSEVVKLAGELERLFEG